MLFPRVYSIAREADFETVRHPRQNLDIFDLVMHKRKMSPDFQCITISTAVFQALSIVIYLVEGNLFTKS